MDHTPSTGLAGHHVENQSGISADDIVIEPLIQGDESTVRDLIRRNLQGYEEAGTVLAATFRRLEALFETYSSVGHKLFVARDMSKGGQPIGAAGLGTFHGLPLTEKLGEVRDMVVEGAYRGRGLGTRLLKRCLDESRKTGYQRIYLETTPQMEQAKKLFLRYGFRPITQGGGAADPSGNFPSYFLLEQNL